tara:strand:- start:247 stop:462 length:216 start_codon:yes stop_codon:yes gene_type:complete
MQVKQAILKAFIKQFGFKEVDKEVLAQSDPISLKAIKAVFYTFEDFIAELRAEKEVVKTTPVKAPVKKVTK